jgi:hypothetical protein
MILGLLVLVAAGMWWLSTLDTSQPPVAVEKPVIGGTLTE